MGGELRRGRAQHTPFQGGLGACFQKLPPCPPLLLPLGLLSYRTSFMSKYQVLCYCSLAKPGPHTKSKILVSQDRYGIVFMHGQNVMADISARSQSFHFGFCPCILILGHCLVSQPQQQPSLHAVTPSSNHLTTMHQLDIGWYTAIQIMDTVIQAKQLLCLTVG